MIKKIRLLLEYKTYPVWLYDEDGDIVDNDNPPELKDDKELTDAFMKVSDLYDTFFIDNTREFRYIGCSDPLVLQELKKSISDAISMLLSKIGDRYELVNDIELPQLGDCAG